MATEYKLSYTAAEIDEKLGKIDALEAANASVEPAYDDIPKVFFGGELAQTKDDTVMTFRYISKTADINGYCKTKAQGNTSMSFPKKNQTVKLYKDANCTEKLKIDFKGWGEQNKFCFKANWIDLTHARNIVSARLWGDVVKSRANYMEIPELLRTSPNHGAVDGFPVRVYANGVYQGRYTINIPKDAWMANMNDELNTHCILCSEGNDINNSSKFKDLALIDGTDWSDEIHDIVPDTIKTRWNEAIDLVMNGTDDEFITSIGEYFDILSIIDYYLFGLVSSHHDGFNKNQLYMTYDGLKWYATVYDLDSTFGLYWDGEQFVSYDHIDYLQEHNNLLYYRLFTLFRDEIRTRWNELKMSALNIDNILNHFEQFIDVCPPWLVEEDYAETTANGWFASIPSKDTNNIRQLRDYVIDRWVFADSVVANILYPLSNGVKTFDSGAVLTVANGYRVNLTRTDADSYEHSVNILRPSANSNNINTWDNMAYKDTVFEVKAGDIIKTVLRCNEIKHPTITLVTSGEHGSVKFTDIYKRSAGIDTITVDEDMKIGAISMYVWFDGFMSIEFDLEIYVNGVRYV